MMSASGYSKPAVKFAKRQILFQDNSIVGTVDENKYTIGKDATEAIQALNLLQVSSC